MNIQFSKFNYQKKAINYSIDSYQKSDYFEILIYSIDRKIKFVCLQKFFTWLNVRQLNYLDLFSCQ